MKRNLNFIAGLIAVLLSSLVLCFSVNAQGPGGRGGHGGPGVRRGSGPTGGHTPRAVPGRGGNSTGHVTTGRSENSASPASTVHRNPAGGRPDSIRWSDAGRHPGTSPGAEVRRSEPGRRPDSVHWSDRGPQPGRTPAAPGLPDRPGRPHIVTHPGPHPEHHPSPVPPPPGPHHPFPFDPAPYHPGWAPYRPVYPWWIDVAEFGAGYALGYYMAAGRPVYYYYPAETTGTVYYKDETVVETTTDEPITEAVPNNVAENSILEDAPATDEATKDEQSLPQVTKAEIDAAWNEIQTGDSAFAKGDLALAVAQYTKVSSDLSALPDSWFRLGYAEMARGNYEQAQEFILKGIEASRIWPASPFSLDYVYQSAADRKKNDLAALEKTVENKPKDGGLNLLAGLTFFSDGQEAKAAKYLKIAKKITPEWAEFVDPVLKNIQ